MKKRTMLVFALLLSGLLGAHAQDVRSLRGDVAIDTEIPPEYNNKVIVGLEDHSEIFNQQASEPNMIPHSTEGMKITEDTNMCLVCHLNETNGATHVPESHYFDNRTGETTKDIDNRRYFCTQCHAPQIDAPPLIEK